LNSRRHILVAALACAPLACAPLAAAAQPAAVPPPAATAPADTAPPSNTPAAPAPAAPAPAPAEPSAAPFDVRRPEIAQWIAEVVSHDGFSRRAVVTLLAKAQPQPKIIEAMNRPLERVAPWWEYRERLLTPERIDRGVQFWLDHQLALERIAAQYQVPPEYLVAIIGVETFYGRSTGHYRVLDVLSTLAFDYPQRGSYFRGELEQYLLLTRENRLDPLTTTGSYAGAMGVPQFMPSVYRRYAVDADTDKKRDLWGDWGDILASVANYLHEHGWAAGGPVLAETTLDPDPSLQPVEPHNLELSETVGALAAHGVKIGLDVPPDTPAMLISAEQRDGPAYRVGFHNFYVITRYNVSARYAMAVYDLARTLAARVHGTPP
jgi:membrane-bound lytic murein transglycosylase B